MVWSKTARLVGKDTINLKDANLHKYIKKKILPKTDKWKCFDYFIE
jgi:hypothetical protein